MGTRGTIMIEKVRLQPIEEWLICSERSNQYCLCMAIYRLMSSETVGRLVPRRRLCGLAWGFFFNMWPKISMFEFARKRQACLYCRSNTTSSDTVGPRANKGITKEMKLSNPQQAEMAWEGGLFHFLTPLKTRILLTHYINCHWDSHRMWLITPPLKG